MSFKHIRIRRFHNVRSNTPWNKFTISSNINNNIVHFCWCISTNIQTFSQQFTKDQRSIPEQSLFGVRLSFILQSEWIRWFWCTDSEQSSIRREQNWNGTCSMNNEPSHWCIKSLKNCFSQANRSIETSNRTNARKYLDKRTDKRWITNTFMAIEFASRKPMIVTSWKKTVQFSSVQFSVNQSMTFSFLYFACQSYRLVIQRRKRATRTFIQLVLTRTTVHIFNLKNIVFFFDGRETLVIRTAAVFIEKSSVVGRHGSIEIKMKHIHCTRYISLSTMISSWLFKLEWWYCVRKNFYSPNFYARLVCVQWRC